MRRIEMNRAEKRRMGKKAAKTPTYNFTKEQLDELIKKSIGDELEKMKKEALEDAVNTAMTLFLVIPMEVLMDYYWPKSYEKRIPEFADRVLDYYYRWQIGELDMEKMEKDLETYAGIKFVEERLDG